MDPKEQNLLLADTIEMVMRCLHYHQDAAVKETCREFLKAYAFTDDEYDEFEEIEDDDDIIEDDGRTLGSRYFDRADDEYEARRDDKCMDI